jgi:hypothetical protein
MANFAAQLKDKLLGLLDRVVNCGCRAGAGTGGDKDVPEEPGKLPNVQVCHFSLQSRLLCRDL